MLVQVFVFLQLVEVFIASVISLVSRHLELDAVPLIRLEFTHRYEKIIFPNDD